MVWRLNCFLAYVVVLFYRAGRRYRLLIPVRESYEPEPNPSLEVTPCEAKPKSVGENFASGRYLSKTQASLKPQSKSCCRSWRTGKNGGATLQGCDCQLMTNLQVKLSSGFGVGVRWTGVLRRSILVSFIWRGNVAPDPPLHEVWIGAKTLAQPLDVLVQCDTKFDD